MVISIENGSLFIDSKHVSGAIEALEILTEELEVVTGLEIYQEVWSIEIEFGATGNNLIARLFLVNSRRSHLVISLPKTRQEYLISENIFFPISENSKHALEKIQSIGLLDFDDLSISEFVFLEQLFVDLQLKNSRNVELQRYLGQARIQHEEFPLKLKLHPWPYQKIGIEWILSRFNLSTSGALLADFMGLGKTLQSIGVITHLAEIGKANRIVVVPNHLLINWTNEITKFAPDLSVLVHKGAQRFGVARLLEGYDAVLTTYPVLIKDISMLAELSWQIVIADEAQAIKNRRSRSSRCVKALDREFSVAVSGTPLETSMLEYFSLMEFVSPSTFGDWQKFQNRIEQSNFDPTNLHDETSHVKLRRNLEDVGSQLPPIVVIAHVLEWPQEYDGLYEEVRLQALNDFPRSGGFQASLRLRQLTTHPHLLGIGNEEINKSSPKFQTLVDLIDEIFANNERVLVFTAFNKMNDLIVSYFKDKYPNFTIASLYGETTEEERHQLVEKINAESGPGLLVCNVIVAGTGLNIQGANHVIHYNLEWNPAKEDQASWRVIRPGQKRNIFIHRLMYAHTIDETIDERIQLRRHLAAQVVEGVVTSEDYLAGLEVSPVNFRN